jgi:hypothetical protein
LLGEVGEMTRQTMAMHFRSASSLMFAILYAYGGLLHASLRLPFTSWLVTADHGRFDARCSARLVMETWPQERATNTSGLKDSPVEAVVKL